MPCSICRQVGHNRVSCPHRVRVQNSSPGPPSTPPPSTPPSTPPLILVPFVQPLPPVRNYRELWKKAFHHHKLLNRFKRCAAIRFNLLFGPERTTDEPMIYVTRIVYLSWLKVKDIFLSVHLDEIEQLKVRYCAIRSLCEKLHLLLNPIAPPIKNTRIIEIVNMKSENYLIYWVMGNYLIQDIDRQENGVKYMGMITKMGKFSLDTLDGHRFHLIPHRLDISPAYHPGTDKQFFIEPYCHINIHDKLGGTIYIDDKDELSELNRWKFNALKLDFLIKQVIMLGGKNNDVLESVLDLHQDISLGEVSEIEKDYAGIPSEYTNIT